MRIALVIRVNKASKQSFHYNRAAILIWML